MKNLPLPRMPLEWLMCDDPKGFAESHYHLARRRKSRAIELCIVDRKRCQAMARQARRAGHLESAKCFGGTARTFSKAIALLRQRGTKQFVWTPKV